MKELSIEEKARRYDEAKYIMKEYLESGKAGVIAENTIKKAFPELSESDDERIRKEIVEAVELHKDFTQERKEYIYAWLEKQAQKPDTNCLLSWSETDEKMLQSLEGIVKDYWAKAEQEKNEIKIREASNVSYFLKTIQKSPLCWIKCSDELPNRDGIYLVVTDGRHNDVYDMARYDSIKGWHKASEIIYWMPIPQLNNKSIIEQKPTDTDNKFIRMRETKPKDISEFLDRLTTVEQEFLWEHIAKIRELDKEEQKPADNIEKPWSEDDNKHFERILKELENQRQRPLNRPYLEEIESDYNWLNSIKDRVQLKQEWNEEDKNAIQVLKNIVRHSDEIDENIYTMPLKEKLYDWLKSLRPQLQWKPSDEQMENLSRAFNSGTFRTSLLMSLYQDLKKLREE